RPYRFLFRASQGKDHRYSAPIYGLHPAELHNRSQIQNCLYIVDYDHPLRGDFQDRDNSLARKLVGCPRRFFQLALAKVAYYDGEKQECVRPLKCRSAYEDQWLYQNSYYVTRFMLSKQRWRQMQKYIGRKLV